MEKRGKEVKRFVKFALIALIMPFGRVAASVPHFAKGATGRIKCDHRIFDFSEDGACLWVVSKDFTTNCYSLAGKRIDGSELGQASPPLERFAWKVKMLGVKGAVKLKRDDVDRSQFPKLCEMELGSRLNVQAYSSGLPCFYYHGVLDIEGNQSPSWSTMKAPLGYLVLCSTDFNSFCIKQVIPCERFVRPWDIRASMSGTNWVVHFESLGKEELYFYSGRIEKLGDSFKKKAKRLAFPDLRRIVGDNGVFKLSSVFFLSENIVAIAPSSAEGRDTYAGRGYLLLYDFRTDKIFWCRKSDSEFFHWNQRVSVLVDDAALSADERKLAVSSGGIIYLYDLNLPPSKGEKDRVPFESGVRRVRAY